MIKSIRKKCSGKNLSRCVTLPTASDCLTHHASDGGKHICFLIKDAVIRVEEVVEEEEDKEDDDEPKEDVDFFEIGLAKRTGSKQMDPPTSISFWPFSLIICLTTLRSFIILVPIVVLLLGLLAFGLVLITFTIVFWTDFLPVPILLFISDVSLLLGGEAKGSDVGLSVGVAEGDNAFDESV